MIDPRSAVLYEAYPQLDALGVDGVSRLLGSFSGIEDEANRVTEAAFAEYGTIAGEGDMGDFVESAQDQGIEYYRTLTELKQGVTNLLAVGLYHLFEQHKKRLEGLLTKTGHNLPEIEGFENWAKVEELRLLCNAVKHADGPSASELRKVRPDYFVHPIIRGSPLERHSASRPIVNPMGGTDLFVSRQDLDSYRDALRGFWEEFIQHI